MEGYFKPYETKVHFVTQKALDNDFPGMPHDGLVLAVGETGDGNYASMEYKNTMENNSEFTGNILVGCARACHRMNKNHQLGAYAPVNVTAADFSPHSQEKLLKDFV